VTWDDFFTAEVGAAAALTGLIFVGISINLQRILGLPTIANRALQALLMLLAILGVESLLLVPNQPAFDQGIEIVALAIVTAVVLNAIELRSWRVIEQRFYEKFATHTLELQVPWALTLVGGLALLGNDPWALYLFVPASLASFLIALIEAWVITVEILR
jgi:hypothetical protein